MKLPCVSPKMFHNQQFHMIQLSSSEIKVNCKFVLISVSLIIKIKVQAGFPYERTTLVHIYIFNAFFLKTQRRGPMKVLSVSQAFL